MTETVPVQETAKKSNNLPVILAIAGLVLIVVGIFFPVALAPVEIKASILTFVGGFPISNTFISGWISIVVMVVLFGLATRSMRMVPTGLQNLAETVVEGLVDLAENVAGKQKGREFFALFATIVLYVLLNNWMELLPGFTNATIYVQQGSDKIPLFRSPSADLNFTLVLALCAVV